MILPVIFVQSKLVKLESPASPLVKGFSALLRINLVKLVKPVTVAKRKSYSGLKEILIEARPPVTTYCYIERV